ncbi:hypothetical protein AXG93_2175s1150 [Marchantia polymorpha subsp. ruderalis]|uniref:Uncharacterized protein n=1 Tax=Marchantia polymorpha subsp. ruderalis TaxID=1480154 RepID=A0A176W7T8_MARPO|nr:hypothetical protein AXG93_2175s1150 [Marchantia polymorpha subsp. ruderalis]
METQARRYSSNGASTSSRNTSPNYSAARSSPPLPQPRSVPDLHGRARKKAELNRLNAEIRLLQVGITISLNSFLCQQCLVTLSILAVAIGVKLFKLEGRFIVVLIGMEVNVLVVPTYIIQYILNTLCQIVDSCGMVSTALQSSLDTICIASAAVYNECSCSSVIFIIVNYPVGTPLAFLDELQRLETLPPASEVCKISCWVSAQNHICLVLGLEPFSPALLVSRNGIDGSEDLRHLNRSAVVVHEGGSRMMVTFPSRHSSH